MSYARGVADCVRVLERCALQIAALPQPEDVRLAGARSKRAAIVDLLNLLAEQFAALATPEKPDGGGATQN